MFNKIFISTFAKETDKDKDMEKTFEKLPKTLGCNLKNNRLTWDSLISMVQFLIDKNEIDPNEEVIFFDDKNQTCKNIVICSTSLYLEDSELDNLEIVELVGRTDNKQKYIEYLEHIN